MADHHIVNVSSLYIFDFVLLFRSHVYVLKLEDNKVVCVFVYVCEK